MAEGGAEFTMATNNYEVDLVLLVGNLRFHCNRSLLVKKSAYFKAMFSSDMIERNSDSIRLQDVCPSAMEFIMTYVRTNELLLTDENVSEVLRLASMLQFVELHEACADYLLRSLSLSNCLGIMFLSDSLMIHDLNVEAKKLAMWDFDLVQQRSEILDMPLSFVCNYFSDDTIRVRSEVDVFLAVVRWINHDKPNRSVHFEELLTTVRFSETTTKEIKLMARNEFVKECSRFRRILSTVWRIKFERQRLERRDGGKAGTSAQSSPLSDMSPAESCDAVNGAGVGDGEELPREPHEVPEGVETQDIELAEGDKSEFTPNRLRTMEVNAERVLALRLLSSGPRSIFMIPCVISHANEKSNERGPEKPLELDFISYDTQRKKLSRIAPVKKAFQVDHVAVGSRACAVGNAIYLIGGEFLYGRSNWNMAVWKYNVFTKLWSLVVNMRNPRRHHTLCVVGDDIYVIGGMGRFRVAVSSVEVLCTYPVYWCDVPPMPGAVHSATSTCYEGKVYVLATNVYRYEPERELWTHMNTCRLPNEIAFHSALPHANGIYLVGGCSTDLVLFLVREGERQKAGEVTRVVGRFEHLSENACIIENKIYSFSSSRGPLIVQSYDIATDQFAIECSGDGDGCRPVGAAHLYGCFPLPKYA